MTLLAPLLGQDLEWLAVQGSAEGLLPIRSNHYRTLWVSTQKATSTSLSYSSLQLLEEKELNVLTQTPKTYFK